MEQSTTGISGSGSGSGGGAVGGVVPPPPVVPPRRNSVVRNTPPPLGQQGSTTPTPPRSENEPDLISFSSPTSTQQDTSHSNFVQMCEEIHR